MKKLKRFVVFILSSLSILIFGGCERTNDLRSVHFSEITAPNSTSFAVKITLDKDSRVNEKYFDIQIKSSKEIHVSFHEENKQSIDLVFDDTKWKSLTNLVFAAEGNEGKETFAKYKDIQGLTYIFSCEEDVSLTFRAVVGESKQNALATGYILTNSKEISDEFVLHIK